MTIYRMCVSIYISIYPLTYVCMLAYLYLPIYQYLSIHLPTYLIYLLISICPSIHPSIYFVCPFIYLSIYLSIHPATYLCCLSINLCVLSLRKKPISKFMPPFLLHLSLTFYREWNTVTEIPLWVSAHRVLWNSCISIFSLSLSLFAVLHGLRDLSSPTRDRTWAFGSESVES